MSLGRGSAELLSKTGAHWGVTENVSQSGPKKEHTRGMRCSACSVFGLRFHFRVFDHPSLYLSQLHVPKYQLTV